MNASIRFIAAVTVLALCLPAEAHETEQKIPSPGFRMQTELAQSFVDHIRAATVRIYPTIIRTPTNTTFSTTSQDKVVAFLKAERIATAVKDEQAIDPGQLNGHSQFEFCQNDMKAIGSEIQNQTVSEDYILVMEVLFPPTQGSSISVFGIHCIVLNNEGENVFTFLLNSHHQIFVDAQMVSDDLSAESHEKLIMTATRIGLEALILQIEQTDDQ